MKPLIDFIDGRWWCGDPAKRDDYRLWWSCASRPCEALRLWMQSRFWKRPEASE